MLGKTQRKNLFLILKNKVGEVSVFNWPYVGKQRFAPIERNRSFCICHCQRRPNLFFFVERIKLLLGDVIEKNENQYGFSREFRDRAMVIFYNML